MPATDRDHLVSNILGHRVSPRGSASTPAPLRPSKLTHYTRIRRSSSGFEIARPIEIGNQPGLLRPPPQQFLSSLARGRAVESGEGCKPAKMIRCLLG